jgi:hypothetical protein
MLAFIQSQPSVVERILRHVETPSFVDLLVRIIQLDEHPGGTGVLQVPLHFLHQHLDMVFDALSAVAVFRKSYGAFN